ncbi:MAG TPA: transposase [Steroidobacteraceae bacterium]|jgi:transposase|nr:transposase [Steroidobacteraceae bacterium]
MDASVTQPKTDALGRRNGPRRKYTISEKRQIAQETLQPGVSVAVVSQRRGINADLIFGWRRMLQQGLLIDAAIAQVPLLPVKVTTPTLTPAERSTAKAVARREQRDPVIEIELGRGKLIRVRGLDGASLVRLIESLARR